MYDLTKTGERCKKLRMKKGKTQEQVEKETGINIHTYRGIERNRYSGRVDTLCALAKYYDTSVDYLLGKDPLRDNGTGADLSELNDERKLLADELIKAILQVLQVN